MSAEEPGPWRRDAGHVVRCLCGHLDSEHRADLVRTSPCSRGGCGCQHMRPDVRLYREHRWVARKLDGPVTGQDPP